MAKLFDHNIFARAPLQQHQEFDVNQDEADQHRLAPFYPLTITHFDVGQVIGTGSFSRVNFVKHKVTGLLFAMKRIKKHDILRLNKIDCVKSEVTILNRLHHPCIVKFAGTFHDSRYVYLVMEYVPGGEFYSLLRKRGRLEDNDAKFYAAQIILIFEYIHSLGIIYRDLKPENLILDKNGYLKLIDFGSAKRSTKDVHRTLCSTPEYVSPEVLLMKEHDGKGIDWWTLGILTYEMVVGQPPFVDEDPECCYQLIISGKFRTPRYLEAATKNVIKKLLVVDSARRLGKDGAEQCKRHKWFNSIEWDILAQGKIKAAIIPRVCSESDTANFDVYPESLEEAPEIDDSRFSETTIEDRESSFDLYPVLSKRNYV